MISNILSLRLKTILHKVIDHRQYAFIEGRGYLIAP